MAVDREAIFAAFFTRMQAGLSGVRYFTRVFPGWSQLSKMDKQPAAILTKGDERPVQRPNMPPKWELDAFLIVCATVANDPSVAPSTLLNQWTEQIDALFQRQPGEVPSPEAMFMPNPDMMYTTTLGGLCTSVRINGTIDVEEGVVGEQSVLVVPIIFTAPG